MSFTIKVSGHREPITGEDAAAFEQSILKKARKFVASLEGVIDASFIGGHLGTISLNEVAEAASTDEDGDDGVSMADEESS